MTLHATCADGPLVGASFTIETCPRVVRCVRAADGTTDILNEPDGKAFSATMIQLRHAPDVRQLRAPDPINEGAARC